MLKRHGQDIYLSVYYKLLPENCQKINYAISFTERFKSLCKWFFMYNNNYVNYEGRSNINRPQLSISFIET